MRSQHIRLSEGRSSAPKSLTLHLVHSSFPPCPEKRDENYLIKMVNITNDKPLRATDKKKDKSSRRFMQSPLNLYRGQRLKDVTFKVI